MIYLKERVITQADTKALINFLVLSGVAILLPFFIHIQWLTGPIVNALLVATLFISGIRAALVLCLVPSLTALAGGLLPAILAPAVPFIMLGNMIFILVIDWFYHSAKDDFRGYWLGVFFGAALKFLFLISSVNLISRLLIKQELAIKVAQMMSWPQFATAIVGGLLAYGFLKKVKRI